MVGTAAASLAPLAGCGVAARLPGPCCLLLHTPIVQACLPARSSSEPLLLISAQASPRREWGRGTACTLRAANAGAWAAPGGPLRFAPLFYTSHASWFASPFAQLPRQQRWAVPNAVYSDQPRIVAKKQPSVVLMLVGACGLRRPRQSWLCW